MSEGADGAARYGKHSPSQRNRSVHWVWVHNTHYCRVAKRVVGGYFWKHQWTRFKSTENSTENVTIVAGKANMWQEAT